MSKVNTKLLTPKQVAGLLQVSPRTVTKWCRDGRIVGAKKLGRVWRISADYEVK